MILSIVTLIVAILGLYAIYKTRSAAQAGDTAASKKWQIITTVLMVLLAINSLWLLLRN